MTPDLGSNNSEIRVSLVPVGKRHACKAIALARTH
jgi:hypothetical protein